jgi:ferrous iron transport protein B
MRKPTLAAISRNVDLVLTSRFLGLPISLALMYGIFYVTLAVGETPVRWMERCVVWLSDAVTHLWSAGSQSDLRSLIVDGIIGGVGNVLVFMPNVLLLFFSIAALEESGYMARAAVVADRLMQKFGLHGKSFVPMVIGFDCTVPAIMAARNIESRHDRLTTMFVLPLISCGARFPTYALIIPAFFPSAWHAPVLWGIYVIGIVLAVIGAKLLRITVLKGPKTTCAVELPPFRIPTPGRLFTVTWRRGYLVLRKAGTFILLISVVMWFATSYPKIEKYDKDYDALTRRAVAEYETGVRRIDAELGLDSRVDLAGPTLKPAAWRCADNGQLELAPASREDKGTKEPMDEGAVLDRFHVLCHAVEDARRAFEVEVATSGARPGSKAWAASVATRDGALARFEKEDPALYRATVEYLDAVKGPFEARMGSLSAEKHVEELSRSFAGRVGRGVLEPALKPLGFDWKIATSLIGAMAGKEVFVAQLGIVHSVGTSGEKSTALRERLKKNYSPLVGFCIIIWILVATPCAATCAVMRHECGSWKWTLAQFGGLTLLAYLLTMIVYQAGSFFRVGV